MSSVAPQVDTNIVVRRIHQISHTWRIAAVKPRDGRSWRWEIMDPMEVQLLRNMIADKLMIGAQRRDGDGDKFLVKLAGKTS